MIDNTVSEEAILSLPDPGANVAVNEVHDPVDQGEVKVFTQGEGQQPV